MHRNNNNKNHMEFSIASLCSAPRPPTRHYAYSLSLHSYPHEFFDFHPFSSLSYWVQIAVTETSHSVRKFIWLIWIVRWDSIRLKKSCINILFPSIEMLLLLDVCVWKRQRWRTRRRKTKKMWPSKPFRHFLSSIFLRGECERWNIEKHSWNKLVYM